MYKNRIVPSKQHKYNCPQFDIKIGKFDIILYGDFYNVPETLEKFGLGKYNNDNLYVLRNATGGSQVLIYEVDEADMLMFKLKFFKNANQN